MTRGSSRVVGGSRGAIQAAAAVATFFCLAGCTAAGNLSPELPSLSQAPGQSLPAQSASPEAAAQPAPEAAVPPGNGPAAAEADPAAVSPGAEEAVTAVQGVLATLATQSGRPSTEQVRTALAAAGFAGPGVEVTATSTPTGLEADAVQAAVLQGSECIMGHVREGAVTVTVLPVLASGRCFVGSVLQ